MTKQTLEVGDTFTIGNETYTVTGHTTSNLSWRSTLSWWFERTGILLGLKIRRTFARIGSAFQEKHGRR